MCDGERNLVKHHVQFHVPKEVLEKHQLISNSNFKTKLQLCFCNRKSDNVGCHNAAGTGPRARLKTKESFLKNRCLDELREKHFYVFSIPLSFLLSILAHRQESHCKLVLK